MLAALTAGFFLGASLIIAIGSQNAFVLRQGLRGEHVALICLTCALSDALLITAGVLGFGELVERSPWIGPVARFGGAAFLGGYALLAFVSAWRGGGGLEAAERAAHSWQIALVTCLALTWLNPHVYLDTLAIAGSSLSEVRSLASRFHHGCRVRIVPVLFIAWIRHAIAATADCTPDGLARSGRGYWPGDAVDCCKPGAVAQGLGTQVLSKRSSTTVTVSPQNTVAHCKVDSMIPELPNSIATRPTLAPRC